MALVSHPLAGSNSRVRLGYIYSGAKKLDPVVPMDGITRMYGVPPRLPVPTVTRPPVPVAVGLYFGAASFGLP